MIAAAWFFAGTLFGMALSAIGIIIALRWPEPKREMPIYSVNGGRSTRTTGPQDVFTSVNSKLL
jgi:hypothetical protein